MQQARARRQRRQNASNHGGLAMLKVVGVLLGVGLVVLALAGAFVVVFGGGSPASLRAVAGEPGPMGVLERWVVTTYLRQNINGLTLAVDPDDTTAVQVTIAPGETAGGVSERLARDGLVNNGTLLLRYLQYRGWDTAIEAGVVRVSRHMTVVEVAEALTDAAPTSVQVRLWAGWRLEQVAAGLVQHPALAVDEAEFLALAGQALPYAADYPFVAGIPAGLSLEGYLLPGDYRLAPYLTSEEALRYLLGQFEAQVAVPLGPQVAGQALTLHEVVTLASIVEREAVHAEEYPRIASVYLNRLAIGMRLEADPTTQYGLASPADWWPPLNLSPRTVDHPYNTYVIGGLPPGPIASPSVAAIAGVLAPEVTDYLFFRAACDGSGYHNFALDYEAHLANGCD